MIMLHIVQVQALERLFLANPAPCGFWRTCGWCPPRSCCSPPRAPVARGLSLMPEICMAAALLPCVR